MKYEITKDFILEAHKAACSDWKSKIEKEFPDLFKVELEVGKWYKWKYGDSPNFCFYKSKSSQYGFSDLWVEKCYWMNGLSNGTNVWILAAEEEVKEMLLKEAESRGYKVGDKLNRSHFLYNSNTVTLSEDVFEYFEERLEMGGYAIYEQGEWAEIIDENKELKEEIESLQKKLEELKQRIK